MEKSTSFKIKSTIEILFKNPDLCTISYNSFTRIQYSKIEKI